MYKNLLKANNSKLGLLFSKDLESQNLIWKLKRGLSVGSPKLASNLNNKNSIGFRENFADRHIGINEKNEKLMLKTLNLNVNPKKIFSKLV